MDNYHSAIIRIGEACFLARFVTKYLAKGTKKVVQYAIVETDVLLECIRLRIINQTNHHINGLQSKLFLLSMKLDGIRSVDRFCNGGSS